jgi:drug/metabolite transporter (DMT)-like permease
MAYGAFWFSLMSLLVKVAGQGLPSQQVVLVRGVITLVLSYALVRRARVSPWGKKRKLLFLRGAFGFVALSLFYFSLVHLPLADASVIQYTNPVWVALLAALLLGERTAWGQALVLAACLAGVVLIAQPSFLFGGEARLPPLYVALALFGAFCSACAYVTIRKLTDEHPLVIVFYLPVVTVVGTIPIVGPVLRWPTPLEWAVLLGVGVTTQIAQVYMTRGLQLEPAGRATAVGYLQIVFAGVWGALFFAEYPDALSLLGAALIVGSTLLMAVWRGMARGGVSGEQMSAPGGAAGTSVRP